MVTMPDAEWSRVYYAAAMEAHRLYPLRQPWSRIDRYSYIKAAMEAHGAARCTDSSTSIRRSTR